MRTSRAVWALRLGLVGQVLLGCAHPSGLARGSRAAVAPLADDPTEVRARARGALLAGLENLADRSHARDLGVPLAAANGTLTLTGEPSGDERFRAVSELTTVGDAMALWVTSDCGNAWLVGMRFVAPRWRPVEALALVGDARPGQCRTTEARAEARAMSTAARREVVVMYGSQSDEGDESRPPMLRVFQLGDDGTLRPLSEPLPFGSDGDARGIPEYGEWTVDEALALPRDLYVEIRPRTVVRGGPSETVRRVYRLRDAHLVQIDESRAPARPEAR